MRQPYAPREAPRIKKRGTLTAALFVAALPALTGSLAVGDESKTFVAYSMKVAQARVEAAVKAGEDFRKKDPELFYLGGITKPWAVVLDRETGDWILVAERDPKSSILTLDDWVVALRARFIHPEKDPGVTIDPRPCEECLKAGKREACSHYTRHDVRFFGGIENTHFGQVCFEADWLMKKIGLGLEKLPVKKLKTYYDLSLEQHRNAGATSSRVGSRFWFYPIVNRVNVLDDVVLLEKFQMGVFTEVLYAEVDGKPVTNVDKFEHYPSEGFSRSFSENYDAAAQAREVLEALRGLTRLAALAKGLTQMNTRQGLDFLLTTYPLPRLSTPREADVLQVGNREVGFDISGGVDLMALTMRLQGGDVSALREVVFRARRATHALSWNFETELANGLVSGIRLASRSSEHGVIAPLLQQATFLHSKKRYDATVECCDKVLQIDSNCRDAHILRGAAHTDLQNYAEALQDFQRALANAHAGADDIHHNIGVLYERQKDWERAAQAYGRACELAPARYTSGLLLATALVRAGRKQEGLRQCEEVALAVPTFADAYAVRGWIWLEMGRWHAARASLEYAVSLGDESAQTLATLGVACYHAGEYAKARQHLQKALRHPCEQDISAQVTSYLVTMDYFGQ